MKLRSLFGFFLFCYSFAAQAGDSVGFLGGNIRTAIVAKGDISMNCHDSLGYGQDFYLYSCEAHALSEGEYDYFVGPPGVPADKVILTAFREDGSHRTKKVDYNTRKGRSDKVNLWVRSLFHKGLLKGGVNRIVYVMKKDDHVTDRGEFIVRVLDGGKHRCHNIGHFWYDLTYLCPSRRFACDAYFRENNFCIPKLDELEPAKDPRNSPPLPKLPSPK